MAERTMVDRGGGGGGVDRGGAIPGNAGNDALRRRRLAELERRRAEHARARFASADDAAQAYPRLRLTERMEYPGPGRAIAPNREAGWMGVVRCWWSGRVAHYADRPEDAGMAFEHGVWIDHRALEAFREKVVIEQDPRTGDRRPKLPPPAPARFPTPDREHR